MTWKQANDVWLVLVARASFRYWAADDFKSNPDRMRDFVVAVMKAGNLRNAAKVYDWATEYLNSKSREEMAKEIMEYPELVAHWAENPIWKQVGVSPPWTLH